MNRRLIPLVFIISYFPHLGLGCWLTTASGVTPLVGVMYLLLGVPIGLGIGLNLKYLTNPLEDGEPDAR